MPEFERVFNHSRRRKIDECEITLVTKRIVTIRITDSEIAEIKEIHDKNFGVRIINDKRIFAHQTNNWHDVEDVIDDLPNIPATSKREFWESLPQEIDSVGRLEGMFDRKLTDINGTEAIDIAEEMIHSTLDDRISSVSGSLNIVSERFEIGNSNGLSGSDDATYISGTINAQSESGTVPVSGIGQGCCRTLEEFSAEKIGSDAKDMCLGSINPKTCEYDRCTIIFEPYSVGELLAFVTFPNFSLKLFSEGRSCLTDQLGQQIASKDLNLMDDPHIPQGIGTKSFDEEGIATKQNLLIGDGIFQNTFSDLYDGFKEGRRSTGNAARTGLPMGRSAEPVPRAMPHNLHIKSGDRSQDEMIRETRHGLLVGRLWYTYALNPIKGDFSCTARSGIRIIKDGEITSSGKPVRIIHSLLAVLRDISGIGKDKKRVLQWASVPTISPSITVKNVPIIPI